MLPNLTVCTDFVILVFWMEFEALWGNRGCLVECEPSFCFPLLPILLILIWWCPPICLLCELVDIIRYPRTLFVFKGIMICVVVGSKCLLRWLN